MINPDNKRPRPSYMRVFETHDATYLIDKSPEEIIDSGLAQPIARVFIQADPNDYILLLQRYNPTQKELAILLTKILGSTEGNEYQRQRTILGLISNLQLGEDFADIIAALSPEVVPDEIRLKVIRELRLGTIAQTAFTQLRWGDQSNHTTDEGHAAD
jgi:hypothetical protein